MPLTRKNYLKNKGTSLHDRQWQSFRYDKVFDIHGGFYNKKPSDDGNGNIPFIGATEYNNGVTSWHEIQKIGKATKDGKSKNHSIEKKIFKGDTYITISNDGSVGYAFYQPKAFTCSHSVNPIRLRNRKINAFIAMFLISLIGLEKYRWAYGRKWRPTRMPSSVIKLPVDKLGNPDWQFMEDYTKSLPYSSNLIGFGKIKRINPLNE